MSSDVFFTFCGFLGEFLRFLVRASTVHAAEGCFFSVDEFSVASFVDFAAAVGANVEAGFNGDRDQLGEAFEKASA